MNLMNPRITTLVLLLVLCIGSLRAETFTREGAVDASFFGWTIHRAHTTTAWPNVPFSTWRLWDSYIKWSDIETQDDKFEFDAFDRQVELGHKKGITLIYTLGQTPRWASTNPNEKHAWGYGTGSMPKNLSLWKRYVEKVVTRYKGRILYYEVWNEPKHIETSGKCSGAIFFCGTPTQLVELTKVASEVIKRVDPSARLASPGYTAGLRGINYLDQYLSAGGYKYIDALSFHFYDINPESNWETVKALRTLAAKHNLQRLPIWDSENGFLIQNQSNSVIKEHNSGPFSIVFSPTEAASRIARVHIINAAAGIDRVIWYAWDNARTGAIGTLDKQPTSVAVAYANVQSWLLGSTVECTNDVAEQIVHCRLARAGRTADVYWRKDARQSTSFILPAGLSGRIQYILGATMMLPNVSSPLWNGEPILIAKDGALWN